MQTPLAKRPGETFTIAMIIPIKTVNCQEEKRINLVPTVERKDEKFSFSYNPQGINKDWDYYKLTNGFIDTQGTVEDLADIVAKGWAINGAHFAGKPRSKANAQNLGLLMLDFDNTKMVGGEKTYDPTMTWENAIDHPFLREYATLAYTSPSHRDDWPKLRVVIPLPEGVDADTYTQIFRWVNSQALGCDPAVKDPGRVFYGNDKAKFHFYQPTKVISRETIDECRAKAIQEQQRLERERERQLERLKHQNPDETKQLALSALNAIPPRGNRGEGRYDECLKVTWAICDIFGTEALSIVETWSPTDPKNGWWPEKIIRNYSPSGGIHGGTLFAIAQSYGWDFPITHKIQTFFNGVKKKAKKLLTPTRKEEKRPEYLYNPDHPFPTKERWESWGKPIIKYPEGTDRAAVINQTLANGFNVWEKSWMGLGKSHCVPDLKGGFNKIYYLSQEHRNPTVDGIRDEFTDLIPRTATGYYLDENSKLKEASRDHAGKLEIQPNCSRAEMFRNVFNKGHSIFREKTEDHKATNPICEVCDRLNACRGGQGNSFGYLNQRSKALENRKIRTDINGLDRFCGYEESLLIIDELKSLNPTKDITSSHIQRVLELDRLRDSFNPEIYKSLDYLNQSLKRLSAGGTGRHGLDTQEIRDYLIGEVGKPEWLDELIEFLDANPQDLTDYFREPDSVQTGDKRFKSLSKVVNKLLRGENLKDTLEKLEQLPPNTLIHLLKLIRGDEGIESNLSGERLTLTVDNRWYTDILKQAKGLVLLDATATPEQVQAATGIDDWLIIQEDIKKPVKNLTIRAIETEGLGSNDWSETTLERIKDIRKKLGYDIPTIAFKRYQEELDANGRWFVDNIGSNDFKGEPEITLVGTPYPDYGATKRQYLCLGGKEEDFDDYYKGLVRQQILQAVGRQRCHLYPDQQFTINWIGTGLDLGWLKGYGVTIERVSAYEIAPEAGTKTQVAKTAYLEAIKCLSEKGIKVTQRALAALLGRSQSTISENLARWGMTLKDLLGLAQKIIGSPIESNNSPTDNPELARFLGIDIHKEALAALEAIAVLGWEHFVAEIFPTFPETLRLKLLGYFIGLADHSELMTT